MIMVISCFLVARLNECNYLARAITSLAVVTLACSCGSRLETKALKKSNERLRQELEKYEAYVEDRVRKDPKGFLRLAREVSFEPILAFICLLHTHLYTLLHIYIHTC